MADQERGEAIVDAVIALLEIPSDISGLSARMQELATELEGLEVDRAPLRPGEGTRIRVYPWEATPTVKTSRIVSHALTLRLELMRENPEGEEADQTIAPLYVWTIRRLLGDVTLGHMVTKIEEGRRQWRAAEAEKAHSMLLLDIVATYQTVLDNPEARV